MQPASLRRQRRFNGLRHFRRTGFHRGAEAVDDFAVAADEKLGEVPADLAGERRVRTRQRLVERMMIFAVHLQLGEHRESHIIFGRAEGLDIRFRPRLLMQKLVAREAQHHQALALVFLIQRLQLGVLRRVTALRSDVHDEQNLAFVFLQQGILAIDVLQRNVVERAGRRGGNDLQGQERGKGEQGFHASVFSVFVGLLIVCWSRLKTAPARTPRSSPENPPAPGLSPVALPAIAPRAG